MRVKIEGIRQFATRLCDDNHYATSGINQKAVDIDLRFDNKEKAHKMLENLRDSLELFQYLQDCAELRE
jgi:hypothetical protein